MSGLWLIWRRSGEGTCIFVFKVADGLGGDGFDGGGLFIYLCVDGGQVPSLDLLFFSHGLGSPLFGIS